MKKIFFKMLSVALLLPTIISCDDMKFLDKAPYSHTSPENYYQKLSDFESAIVGCYDAISIAKIGTVDVTYGTYITGLQYMLSAGNDEMVLSTNPGTYDYTAFGEASYVTQNSAISQLWTAFFAGIMRCNYVIAKAAEISLPEGDAARLNEIAAEARFLRGFFYFHLAELFGGVPVYTGLNSDAYAQRCPIEEVYNKVIIPDLDYAYRTLPHRAGIMGAASKWSAAGYLATVYNYLATCKRYNVGNTLADNELNKFDWVNEEQMRDNAKTVLEDIYKNSQYKLIDRYDYLFRETTKSFQQQECLFTVENTCETADTYPQSTALFSPGGSAYGGSYGIYRNTIELYDSYENTGSIDIRRNYNITKSYSASSAKESIEGVNYLIPGTANKSSSDYPGKFRESDPSSRALTKNRSGISIPLIRYADMILQYAEVKYFQGDEPGARSLLTEVRQRIVASGKNVDELNITYHKDNFIEELLAERSRELCFESKRRIDLIRFGKLTDVINSININAGGNNPQAKKLQDNWEEYKIWFPIPQVERDLNKNLTQNYGY
ncbi:RagB/SusD family nutrient uptake outer membrane protein [Bacteroides ovatus]|uniref:RagB/SusD family nutrient uptake outer membrane protein n=1 Tax=Bacteroides ovatus TaxID=28116 RepID=UPI00321AE146